MGIKISALVALGIMGWTYAMEAQVRDSLAGERAAKKLQDAISGEDYNIRLGPVYLRSEARFGLELNDNVFRSSTGEQEDIILKPEIRLDGMWPVTKMNALNLSLGIGYAYFIDNDELNSDAPLISPDTALVWNIFAGDFHIKLREQFSYQETLYIESGSPNQADFINFNNTGRFRRLDNLLGASADWDLNDVILSFSYDHEWFDSMTRRFDYMDRQSDLFSISAKFLPASRLSPGLEAQGSLNDYRSELILNDHWRGTVGPFLEVLVSDHLRMRAGGGYDVADFSGGEGDYDTYYVYGKVDHVVNKIFTHSLSAGRESELGYNANTLRTVFVRYGTRWSLVHNVDISTRLSANFAKEFGGAYFEEFDYYSAGLNVGWQFHKNWRAVLDYSFLWKDSETVSADFDQNRLTLAAVYRF